MNLTSQSACTTWQNQTGDDSRIRSCSAYELRLVMRRGGIVRDENVSDGALVAIPDGRRRGCYTVGGSEIFRNWVMTWVDQ